MNKKMKQIFTNLMYMTHLSQKSPENCHASYHACCSINLTTGMGVCGYLGNIWVNIGPGPKCVPPCPINKYFGKKSSPNGIQCT